MSVWCMQVCVWEKESIKLNKLERYKEDKWDEKKDFHVVRKHEKTELFIVYLHKITSEHISHCLCLNILSAFS